MPSCPGVADCFVSRLLSRTELLHAFAKFLHEIFKLAEHPFQRMLTPHAGGTRLPLSASARPPFRITARL
jgi:hypothetical protein